MTDMDMEIQTITQLEQDLTVRDPEQEHIKAQFFEDLVATLKPKQNKIEMRAIYRHQLDEVIRMLDTGDRSEKRFYFNFSNTILFF